MLVTLRSQRVNELCHGFMISLNFSTSSKRLLHQVTVLVVSN